MPKMNDRLSLIALLTDRTPKSQLILSQIDVPAQMGRHMSIEDYYNGREEGLCLVITTPFGEARCSIANEYRSSDDIAIYRGEIGEAFDAGNIPSDRAGASCCYIRPDDLGQAVQVVKVWIDYIRERWMARVREG